MDHDADDKDGNGDDNYEADEKSNEDDDKKKMNKMLLMIWKTMWMVFG